jgi:hypothetical protein
MLPWQPGKLLIQSHKGIVWGNFILFCEGHSALCVLWYPQNEHHEWFFMTLKAKNVLYFGSLHRIMMQQLDNWWGK